MSAFKNWQQFMTQSAINMMNNPVIKASSVWQRRFGQRALSTVALSAILMNGFVNQVQAALPLPDDAQAGAARAVASSSTSAAARATGASSSASAMAVESGGQAQKRERDRSGVSGDVSEPAPKRQQSVEGFAGSVLQRVQHWLYGGRLANQSGVAEGARLPAALSSLPDEVLDQIARFLILNQDRAAPDLSSGLVGFVRNLIPDMTRFLGADRANLEPNLNQALTSLALTSRQMLNAVNLNPKAEINLAKMTESDFATLHDPKSFASMRLVNKKDITLRLASDTKEDDLWLLIKAMPDLKNLTLVTMDGRVVQVLQPDLENPGQSVINLDGFSKKEALPILCGLPFEIMNGVVKLNLDLGYKNLDADEVRLISGALSTLQNLKSLKLNLEYNKLRNVGMGLISDALKAMKYLTSVELGLAGNNLDVDGVRLISNALSALPDLVSMELDLAKPNMTDVFGSGARNYLNAESMGFISDALKAMKNLTSLRLGLAGAGLDEEGVRLISAALPTLQNLNSLNLGLGYNSLNFESVANISDSLRAMTGLKRLRLDLRHGALGDEDDRKVNAIAGALGGLVNLTSVALDFADNNLRVAQEQTIGDALSLLSNVTSVELGWGWDNLLEVDMTTITNAIGQMSNLENLILVTAGRQMVRLLQPDPESAEQLIADFNGFSAQQTLGILNALPLNVKSKITKLTMVASNENLDADGLVALSDALRSMIGLTNLNLDLGRNRLGDAEVVALRDALRERTRLASLGLNLVRRS